MDESIVILVFEFFLKNLTNFLLLGLIYLLKHFFKKFIIRFSITIEFNNHKDK